MNIQSLPFRTGAGKAQDDGNLLLATWRWAVATEIQRDCHMLTELRCHKEFGDLGCSTLRGRVQQAGYLQLTQEAADTMGTICLPGTLVPTPLLCFLLPEKAHSAFGILFIIMPQPTFWKSLVIAYPERKWISVRCTVRPPVREFPEHSSEAEDRYFSLACDLLFARFKQKSSVFKPVNRFFFSSYIFTGGNQ